MCYDTAQLAYRIYKDAIRMKASLEEVEALKSKWEELKQDQPNHYHASGFDHPELILFEKNKEGLDMTLATWGLIPKWVENEDRAKDLWNRTIIARGESMFEKPSFKVAAEQSRVILAVDGFFEHFHQGGKRFPHYIERSDGKRMLIGALKSSWKNPVSGDCIDSFAIVTTKANELLSTIHNNPKVTESRMPLLLNDDEVETWFGGQKGEVMKLIKPNSSQELKAKTVRPLRGKNYIGNIAAVHEEYEYDELNDDRGQMSLF
jgi:putative SOS response-associated peptidase YedK